MAVAKAQWQRRLRAALELRGMDLQDLPHIEGFPLKAAARANRDGDDYEAPDLLAEGVARVLDLPVEWFTEPDFDRWLASRGQGAGGEADQLQRIEKMLGLLTAEAGWRKGLHRPGKDICRAAGQGGQRITMTEPAQDRERVGQELGVGRNLGSGLHGSLLPAPFDPADHPMMNWNDVCIGGGGQLERPDSHPLPHRRGHDPDELPRLRAGRQERHPGLGVHDVRVAPDQLIEHSRAGRQLLEQRALDRLRELAHRSDDPKIGVEDHSVCHHSPTGSLPGPLEFSVEPVVRCR